MMRHMAQTERARGEPARSREASLVQQIASIDRAIARFEVLLELMATVESQHSRRSDRGWMVSMLTLEAGTLMAVSASGKARRWSAMSRALERDMLRLQAARLLLEHERCAHSEP